MLFGAIFLARLPVRAQARRQRARRLLVPELLHGSARRSSTSWATSSAGALLPVRPVGRRGTTRGTSLFQRCRHPRRLGVGARGKVWEVWEQSRRTPGALAGADQGAAARRVLLPAAADVRRADQARLRPDARRTSSPRPRQLPEAPLAGRVIQRRPNGRRRGEHGRMVCHLMFVLFMGLILIGYPVAFSFALTAVAFTCHRHRLRRLRDPANSKASRADGSATSPTRTFWPSRSSSTWARSSRNPGQAERCSPPPAD